MAAKDAISELYLIMRDCGASERDRINSAVSISRVCALSMPGEQPPEAIVWLRRMVEDLSAPTGYRRECATAVSYWERRCKKAELQYVVADIDERQRDWRRIINGALRVHLVKHGHWPEHNDVLLTAADSFEMPPYDPEVAVSAVMRPSGDRKQRRRQKAIDERLPGVWSGSESERLEIVRSIARAAAARLAEFGLAG